MPSSKRFQPQLNKAQIYPVRRAVHLLRSMVLGQTISAYEH